MRRPYLLEVSMLIIPTWTLSNIILYLGFALTGITLVYLAYHDLWTLQYSKFVKNGEIPSRMGMFILYFLPIVTATVTAWPYLSSANVIQWIVYSAVVFHFGKRVLETLFLHKYSGKMAVLSIISISFIYSLVAGMICYVNVKPLLAMDILFYSGMVIFIIGEVGNFYHHKLLVDLRKGSEGYHIPQGGFFEYAACPHYFFELVSWLGILFLSRHLFAFMALIAFTAYLTERSVKTRQWYLEKFPDYPKDRKCIVPFVF